MNFHDLTGELTRLFRLHAGDDAGAVRVGRMLRVAGVGKRKYKQTEEKRKIV